MELKPILIKRDSTSNPNNIHIESTGKMVLVHGDYIKEQYDIILIDPEAEIKECDLFITGNNTILKCTNVESNWIYFTQNCDNLTYSENKSQCTKITASTDPTLKLPQIPIEFINKYISEYNKGNKIEEVLVGYDELRVEQQDSDIWLLKKKLKIKDNTITIKEVKDSWNKDEITELFHKFREISYYKRFVHRDYLDNWIEKNL